MRSPAVILQSAAVLEKPAFKSMSRRQCIWARLLATLRSETLQVCSCSPWYRTLALVHKLQPTYPRPWCRQLERWASRRVYVILVGTLETGLSRDRDRRTQDALKQ